MRIFGLILLFCSALSVPYRNCFGAVPNPDKIFTAQPSTAPRTIIVNRANRIAVSDTFNYTPVGVDVNNGICYCTTLSTEFAPVNARSLYSTTDGVTFTTVISDIKSVEPFKTYYNQAYSVAGITNYVKLDDNSELLALGVNISVAYDPRKPRGAIFRKPSGGSWSRVLDMNTGVLPNWGFCDGSYRGQYVVVGEYGGSNGAVTNENSPKSVYYSDDYGATWTQIYRLPDGTTTPIHIHQTVFSPSDTNTIYVSNGDNTASGLTRLDYSGGTWTATKMWGQDVGYGPWQWKMGPVGCSVLGNDIYWGSDNSTGGSVIKHTSTVSDDIFEVAYVKRERTTGARPLINNSNKSYCFGIKNINNVLYTMDSNTSRGQDSYNTIMASRDGSKWTVIYRAGASKGLYTIKGLANGKIWGSIWSTASTPKNLGIYWTAPDIRDVNAFLCEKGITNKIATAANATFSSPVTGWDVYNDACLPLCGAFSGVGHNDSNCYRYVRANRTCGYGSIWAPTLSTLCSALPAANQNVLLTFWIKSDSGNDYGNTIEPQIWGLTPAYVTSATKQRGYIVDVNNWQQVTFGATTGACYTNKSWQWMIGLYDNGDANFPFVVYLDDFQVIYDSNDLRSYDSNYVPVGSPRANEYASFSLAGVGSNWTAVFDWYPQNGYLDISSGRVSLASVSFADGNYVEVYWNGSNQKIYITDGTNTVSTTGTYRFCKYDRISLGLNSENSTTLLYIQSPETATTSIDLTAFHGQPSTITLGTNSTFDNWACGAFSYPFVWKRSIASGDMTEVFNTYYTSTQCNVNSNLVSWWKFDDNYTDNLIKDSKCCCYGTVVRDSCDMSIAGKVNGALSFNGTSDYVDTNSTYQQDSLTLTAWVKPDDGQPSNSQVIFSRTVDDGNHFEIYLGTDGIFDANCVVQGVSKTITLYQNGTSVSAMADGLQNWMMLTAVLPDCNISGTENLLIGSSFAGAIDEVKIYDRALNGGEIAAFGDISGDAVVDFVDYAILARYWLNTNCISLNNCGGADFEPDGDVDWDDLKVLTDNWLDDI